MISPIHFTTNAEILSYLTSTIEKTIKLKYSYDNKAVWSKVQYDGIQLPIQTDTAGQPVIDQDKAYHPDGFVPD